ncbi:uncharacterized protein LOC129593666 isoform X2 [Paramacrobiotus metropolitanus]|uniref:uncharacterized protein LOC129593666 isoform X2 n=1 Tax=Paramacrobiotus metropolitanus TaxID=2943436 RepID=UPI002445A0F2|nr:uncharacterized protein LOC129593666 isoform X2 [Paramacrobiotus metropolitanus]
MSHRAPTENFPLDRKYDEFADPANRIFAPAPSTGDRFKKQFTEMGVFPLAITAFTAMAAYGAQTFAERTRKHHHLCLQMSARSWVRELALLGSLNNAKLHMRIYKYRRLPQRDAISTTLYFTGLRIAAQSMAVGIIAVGAVSHFIKNYNATPEERAAAHR